jgi:hypothetical protein
MSLQRQSLIHCIQDLCGNLDAISARRKQLITGAANRTYSNAIIASGKNGQIPVALKACSQLLIVPVRPHASRIAETRRYLTAASSLCLCKPVIIGLRILVGSV